MGEVEETLSSKLVSAYVEALGLDPHDERIPRLVAALLPVGAEQKLSNTPRRYRSITLAGLQTELAGLMRAKSALPKRLEEISQTTRLILADAGCLYGHSWPPPPEIKVAVARCQAALIGAVPGDKYTLGPEETSSGASDKLLPNVIANAIYVHFETLTGRAPGLTWDVYEDQYTGKFYQLVSRVFTLLGIDASPAYMAKEALSQRKSTQ